MKWVKVLSVAVIIVNLALLKNSFAESREYRVSEILKKGHFNLKIRVTDFWRSPKEQAYLLQRLKRQGVNLLKLYKETSIIKEIVTTESVEEIEIIIRKYINQGVYLSNHLCGQALDLSKDKGVQEFISFMSQIKGIKILDEGNHYHLETITKCK